MIKTTNKTSNFNHLKDDFKDKFFFVEDISKVKKISDKIKLCIINTNFDKDDLRHIKKIKEANPKVEFWICSDNLSKKNVLTINKTGIKTVVSSPVDMKMVEDFFIRKENSYPTKDSNIKYDDAAIANSKIMIVDDNNMNIELLEDILSEFNVEITTSTKPKNTYELIQKNKYDLFLLDVMMPEMSGFELSKKIKGSTLNKNTPIVFISALSDSHNKITGYDLGSFAYIEKPFDIKLVKSQVYNILKNQRLLELNLNNNEDFLATIAHDLKTPISAGINALNLLLNKNMGELDKAQCEIIEDLLYSTHFMKDMIENFLCKKKIDNNRIDIIKKPHSAIEVAKHCAEITKYILNEKSQNIKLEINAPDITIPIDFLEIKRALHNLIINASEYSPREKDIIIGISLINQQKVAISVQDFGKGIKLEEQRDVFYQYMSFAKKYKKVGSGLGLYITKNIVEAHGGEVKLESKIGYGTKITMYLPLE